MKSLFENVGGTIKYYPEQKSLEFAEYVEAVKQATKNHENNNES